METEFFPTYVILSHISGILRSGSGQSVFTIKHGLTINFASFNQTVNLKFNGTPINTIESLRLSIEFHAFSPSSRISSWYEHSDFPNPFQILRKLLVRQD